MLSNENNILKKSLKSFLLSANINSLEFVGEAINFLMLLKLISNSFK